MEFHEVFIHGSQNHLDQGFSFTDEAVEKGDLSGKEKELELSADVFQTGDSDVAVGDASLHKSLGLLIVLSFLDLVSSIRQIKDLKDKCFGHFIKINK